MTEKKSATRRAVDEKHLRKPQLLLRIDNGSVNIISGSDVSSSHAVESSFPVVVVITTLGVQMIIPKQERRVMLSARFVAINKRYLDISFIRNYINVEMEQLYSDYMPFAFNALLFFKINQDAQTCARCKTKFSAYFCSMCKHFTGTDKNPYHCLKCGICR